MSSRKQGVLMVTCRLARMLKWGENFSTAGSAETPRGCSASVFIRMQDCATSGWAGRRLCNLQLGSSKYLSCCLP